MIREKTRRGAALFTVVLVLAAGVLSACGGEQPAEVSGEGDGAALLQETCTRCHDLGRVEQAQKTREEWTQTYERMMAKGDPAVPVDAGELDVLIDHLAQTYGLQE